MKEYFQRKLSLTAIMVSGYVLSACSSNEHGSMQESAQSLKDIEVEIIASGANIAGANGLAIGPDGNLYVTSVLGSSISVIEPESGDTVSYTHLRAHET